MRFAEENSDEWHRIVSLNDLKRLKFSQIADTLENESKAQT
jgi:hypothetical protein